VPCARGATTLAMDIFALPPAFDARRTRRRRLLVYHPHRPPRRMRATGGGLPSVDTAMPAVLKHGIRRALYRRTNVYKTPGADILPFTLSEGSAPHSIARFSSTVLLTSLPRRALAGWRCMTAGREAATFRRGFCDALFLTPSATAAYLTAARGARCTSLFKYYRRRDIRAAGRQLQKDSHRGLLATYHLTRGPDTFMPPRADVTLRACLVCTGGHRLRPGSSHAIPQTPVCCCNACRRPGRHFA